MPAHIHAALMAEYAKDALETDKPWERWEKRHQGCDWTNLQGHPGWSYDREYRHKRIPLCQVEGRDVFPGDKLWWKARNKWVIVGGKFANSDSHLRVGSHDSAWPDEFTWTEPAKTKTVYQWAYYVHDSDKWLMHGCFATDEQDWRERTGLMNKAVRLDWTALEVPA